VTGPPDGLLRAAPANAGAVDTPALLAALARAAAALARLDQACAGPHPLLPALLHRARLDAVRRQAAVDGHPIDPWHLAALVEGLRPRRLAGARSIAEAGGLFEAGRTALSHHRWLTALDFGGEGEVRASLVAPPRRPEPGRGRGRPRNTPPAEEATSPPPSPAPPGPIGRPAFDYGDLDAARDRPEPGGPSLLAGRGTLADAGLAHLDGAIGSGQLRQDPPPHLAPGLPGWRLSVVSPRFWTVSVNFVAEHAAAA
jgi:hypothetical protein